MVVPAVAEAPNVVDVDVDIFDSRKSLFHDLLSKVWCLFDAHWGSGIALVAKRSADDTQFFGVIIQLKSVVLHADV